MTLKKLPLLVLSSFALISSSCDKAKEAADNAKEQAASFADLKVDTIGEKAAEMLKDLPDILLSIKDEASLDAASEKLDSITKKTDALVAAASKLPKPPADQQAKLADAMSETIESKWGDKMNAAEKHMGEFVKNNPGLADKVGEFKKKFKASVRPIQNIFDEDGALGGADE